MDNMKIIEDAIVGLADEVTMNPDVVTGNAIRYAYDIVEHKDGILDVQSVEAMLHEISQYGKWQQKVFYYQR